jgi:hypothetical protein
MRQRSPARWPPPAPMWVAGCSGCRGRRAPPRDAVPGASRRWVVQTGLPRRAPRRVGPPLAGRDPPCSEAPRDAAPSCRVGDSTPAGPAPRRPGGAGVARSPGTLGASEWRPPRRLGSADPDSPASRAVPRAVSRPGTGAPGLGACGLAGDPHAGRRGRGVWGASTPGGHAWPSPWCALDPAAREPGSALRHPDSRLGHPRVWAHVRLAPGVPWGLGCVRHPAPLPSPVDAGAKLHGGSGSARPGGPPCRTAVWRGPAAAPRRRVARACPGVGWRTAQPPSWPWGPSPASASAPPPSRRFPRGFTHRLSGCSAARGAARSDAACPPSLPAWGIAGQSRPQGLGGQLDPGAAGMAPAQRSSGPRRG